MDTRILLNYIQRRPWLWGLVSLYIIFVSFLSQPGSAFFYAGALVWVSLVPLTSELQEQGPIWTQQTLPVQSMVLGRTIWALMVVLPVAVVAASLLPAYCYGVFGGNSNFASTDLIRIIVVGLLFTSAYSIFIALGNFWWKHKLPRIFSFMVLCAVGAVVVSWMTEMGSGQYWNAGPTRLGMIVSSVLLMIVSYVLSPHILQVTGRKTSTEYTQPIAESPLTKTRASAVNKILESAEGRALVAGLLLLTVIICFGLFAAIRYEQGGFFDALSSIPVMIIAIFVLPIFLWSVSSIHVTSFRAMACLPITRIRQTLIYLSLPVIAVMPLALFMAITVIFTTTETADVLRMAMLILYGLMNTLVGLALLARFGKITAIVSLFVLTQMLMMRMILQGKIHFSGLPALEILVVLGVILATGLWTHRMLDRNENVYRRQLVSLGATNP